MSLIFDVLLLGVVQALKPKQKYVPPRKGIGTGTTSMEALAFDSMHEHSKLRRKDSEPIHYYEPTEDIHRDIHEDDGPNW